MSQTEDLSKDLSSLADLMEQISKKYSNIEDTSGNIDEQTNDMLKKQKELEKLNEKNEKHYRTFEKSSENLADKFKRIVGYVTSVTALLGATASFVGLAEATRNAFLMEQHMTKLAFQMGKGAKGAHELYSAAVGLQAKLGASAEDSEQIVSSLASQKFLGNIKQAAISIYAMHDATGLSVQEASNLEINLTKVGGLSQKASQAVMASMAKVQYSVGISAEGMSALASNIQESSANMSAMGKTSEQIKQMAVNTTALVGTLEKVGISAQWTTQQIENLTDPERIEDNIGLFSQLGISIQDAMSGDITQQFGEGMKEMGERAKAMGPIAGAQYAKAFGMSYRNLMKATQSEDISKVADTAKTSEEKAVDVLTKLSQQSDAFAGKVTKFINRINGWIAGFGPIALAVVTVIVGIITKSLAETVGRVRASVSTTGKIIEEGITSSYSMGLDKSAAMMKERASKIGRGYSEAWQKAATESSNYVRHETEASMNDIEAQLSHSKLGKWANEASANINRLIAGNKTNINMFRVFSDKQFYSQMNNMKELKAGEDLRKEAIQQRIDLLQKNNGLSEEDYKIYTKLLATKDSLNKDEQSSLKYLQNRVDKNDNMVKKLHAQQEAIKNISDLRMKKLSPESAAMYTEELRKQVQENVNQANELQKQINLENERTDALQKNHDELQKALEIDKASNKLSNSELVERQQKLDQMDKEIKQNSKVNELTKKRNQYTNESLSLNKQIAELAEKTKNATKDTGGFTNNLHRFLGSVKTGFANIGHEITTNIKDSVKGLGTLAKTGAQMINPVNWFKGNKRSSVETGEGGGESTSKKILGGLGKITAILGVSAIVMKLLQPVLEKAKEKFMPMIQKMIEDLQPALDSLLPLLETVFSFLLKNVLPIILRAASVLIPAILKLPEALGWIIQGIGWLVKKFSGKEDIYNFGKALHEGSKSMAETISKGFRDAANDLEKGVTSGVASAMSGENSPAVLQASTGNVINAKAGYVGGSTAASASAKNAENTKDIKKNTEDTSKNVAEVKDNMSIIADRLAAMDKFFKFYFNADGTHQNHPINVQIDRYY